MSSNLQLKQYQNTIWTNILSSQFVYTNPNQKCELKKQALVIEKKKKKNIYYLYLFLITNKKPYVKKRYIVSKNLKKNTTKTRSAGIKWKVEIQKKYFSNIWTQILFEIIPFQTNSENKILNLNRHSLNVIFQFAPLTARTIGLKSNNSYFPDIRLIWKLNWTKSASIFQKIFVLKHFKVLNEANTFQRLEDDPIE